MVAAPVARAELVPARISCRNASTVRASGASPTGPASVRSQAPWASSQPLKPTRTASYAGAPERVSAIQATSATATTGAEPTTAAQTAVVSAATGTGTGR